ncbi:MAG: lactonase family protein, partial [Thermomicrobiales bacterium]
DNGNLSLINHQSSHGVDPCYVSTDIEGRTVFVANYTSGSIAALPILDDGSLGPASSTVQHHGSSVVAGRQEGPHAHMIAPTPDGAAVLGTDLGTDEVVIYRFESGNLERVGAVAVEAGSGPRHFAFSPDATSLYVLNELSSTLDVFTYDSGQLAFPYRQTLTTLPEGFAGTNSTAHVQVSPDGRFVYASNRGHDSIAIFAVEPVSGELSQAAITLTRGEEPRNFGLSPDGLWLLAANQNSDTIVTFRRDSGTGMLEHVGDPVPVQTPVCVVFAH